MCFMNRITSTLKLSKFVRRRDFISRTLLIRHGQYDTSQKICNNNASNISKGTIEKNPTLSSKLLYGNYFRRGLKSKNENLCPLGMIETFVKGSDTPTKVLVTIPYESITNNEVNVDRLVTSLHSLQSGKSEAHEADEDIVALKQSLLTEASRQTGLEFESFQSFEFVKLDNLEGEADAIGTSSTSKNESQNENDATMNLIKNEPNFVYTDSPMYGQINLSAVGKRDSKVPKRISNMIHSFAGQSKKYSTIASGGNSMKIEGNQNVFKAQLDQVRHELTRLLEVESQLVEILAKDPCKKNDDPCKKKEDPCKKKEQKKEDPCKKKEDPCKKKEDPCKKKEQKKEDPCKKKEDPCKKKEQKKEDPCKKKEDPCKKKEDPCKKKEDPCKKKEDPCKKKEDPCKKKEDPCKKKEDPCKKKEDPCKKKEDPCAKKKPSGPCKKKEDPCKKKKRDPCEEKIRNLRKNAPKRKDPCKKKEDPCKKKEDPCKKRENPCKRKPTKDDCKKDEDPCKKKAPKKDPCKKEKKEDPCKKKEQKKEDPCKKKEQKKEDPCKKKEDPCKKKDDPCKKKCSGTHTNDSSYTSHIFGIMHNSFNNKQPSARALHAYQNSPAKLTITRRFSSYVPSKIFQKHHSSTKKSMAFQSAENTINP